MSSKRKYVFYKYDSMGNLNFLDFHESPDSSVSYHGNSSAVDNLIYYSDSPVSPVEGYLPVEVNVAKVMTS